jgi:hypothetical protein
MSLHSISDHSEADLFARRDLALITEYAFFGFFFSRQVGNGGCSSGQGSGTYLLQESSSRVGIMGHAKVFFNL